MLSANINFRSPLWVIAFLLLVGNCSALKLINSKLRCSTLFSSRSQANTDDVADRTFASYVVYKSKAAVSLKMIPPTFQPVGARSRTVSRDGGLLLEFAAALGQREYDWTKKGTFLLDPTECGEIISLDPARGADFIHDPNVGMDKAGQVMKRLKIAASPDGKGLFVTLTVNDKASQPPSTSYSVPMSWGEFNVIKSVANYGIPRFLGFDRVWDNGGLGTPGADMPPTPPPVPVYKNFWSNNPQEQNFQK